MEKFYTYLWLRQDGTPYYVGKGCGRRAYEEHSIGKCPTKERIILQRFESEEDSLFAEKFLITLYGRQDLGTGILRNYTDGGDGATNVSEESRKRRGKALKGRVFSDETKERISKALTGITRSEITRKKISEAKKGTKPWCAGKKLSAAHIKALSESHLGENNQNFGKSFSEEHKRRISEANVGRVFSEEHKSRLKDARNKRPPYSEDTKNKMRASAKDVWARKRANAEKKSCRGKGATSISVG